MSTYSLYWKIDTRFVRISSIALPKAQAVRTFQSMLLGGLHLGACLRPIKHGELYAKLILVPAMNRDYEDAASLLEDWNAGKDFKVIGRTTMCNKADYERYNDSNCLVILYKSQTKGIRIQ